MDPHIIMKAELGDPQAILTLSSCTESASPEQIERTMSAIAKAMHKDIQSFKYAYPKQVATFIQSLLERANRSGLPENITRTLFRFLADALIYQDYLSNEVDLRPMYNLLSKHIHVNADGGLCDDALRTLYVLPDADPKFTEHMRSLIPNLLKIMTDSKEAGLCQLALQSLSFFYEPGLVGHPELCRALSAVYSSYEADTVSPVEDIVPQLVDDLDSHKELASTGLYKEFCSRCEQNGNFEPLGRSINSVIVGYGAGSPLFNDAVIAQSSFGYAQYNVDLLLKPDGKKDNVLAGLENIDRALGMGGEVALKSCEEANVKQAIESTICKLALDPVMPVIDKEVRLLARQNLQKLFK